MPRPSHPRSLARFLVLVSLVACGGGGDGGGDDDGSSGADAGAGAGPFDLNLVVTARSEAGAVHDTLLYVAVRDADSGELVAFVGDDDNLVSTVTIDQPGVLRAGHRYAIGVKDTWFASCVDPSANVWYREIAAVAADVELTLDAQPDLDEDPRGCDVLHEAVALDPGTYQAAVPLPGVTGNQVAIVVSPTGRVYTDELRIYCGTSADCSSTSVGFATCDLEEAIFPGESTFGLGSQAASYTNVEGEATIDGAAQTIRYVGRVYTWDGSFTNCCDETFDVTLARTGPAAAACP